MISFFSYQHGRAQIEFLVELSNENVNVDELILILVFDLANDIRKPFKLLLRARNPDEIELKEKNNK